MSRRSGVLEFAILGLLRESPMHGYELRKRLNTSLGVFRAFSYGSLYPCLKTLVRQGWLAEEHSPPEEARAPLTGRRARIVYRLTAEGKEHFEELLAQTGPDSWEDEHFGVRFAFFGQTSRDVRMRVLEGRRSRLEERLAKMRASLGRTREKLDAYTLELQRHGMESVEREVRWLNELIESEREGRDRAEGAERAEGVEGTEGAEGVEGTDRAEDAEGAEGAGTGGNSEKPGRSAPAGRSRRTARRRPSSSDGAGDVHST